MTPADFDTSFQALLFEWQGIAHADRRIASVTWSAAIEEMRMVEARLRARGLWVRGAADIFGVLGISRAEVRHTKLVAWLMEPAARHGLGARFLERVLARVFPGERFNDLGDAAPACEVVRGECRADIIVSGSSFTLIIEAKIDADESDGQCDYQYEQFSREVGSRFVFLSPPFPRTGPRWGHRRTLQFSKDLSPTILWMLSRTECPPTSRKLPPSLALAAPGIGHTSSERLRRLTWASCGP